MYARVRVYARKYACGYVYFARLQSATTSYFKNQRQQQQRPSKLCGPLPPITTVAVAVPPVAMPMVVVVAARGCVGVAATFLPHPMRFVMRAVDRPSPLRLLLLLLLPMLPGVAGVLLSLRCLDHLIQGAGRPLCCPLLLTGGGARKLLLQLVQLGDGARRLAAVGVGPVFGAEHASAAPAAAPAAGGQGAVSHVEQRTWDENEWDGNGVVTVCKE